MASPLQPAALRSLVSKVMQASCGLSFNPAGDEAISAKPWRTAALPIKGGTPMTVAIGADETACFAMASGLLQMAPNELDPGMVEDSLRELLNMVAGHIKRAMAIDLALGLPEIVPFTEMERRMKGGGQRVAVTTGRVNLTVWVTNQS
jgi:CheY-specific phosphatase CheX